MVEAYTSEVTVPDLFESPGFGLLDNVTWLTGDSKGHWRGGIQYDADCYVSSVTISACFDGGPPSIATKAATWQHKTRGARAFTVFDEYDCSAPGSGMTLDSLAGGRQSAIKALSQSGPFTVESVFWSGNVLNAPAKVYPNLTTLQSSPIVTGLGGQIILQPSGTLITGTLDVVEGLGLLEEAVSNCYKGKAWIHIPSILLPTLAGRNQCYERNGKLYTYAGNRVIVGTGYDPTIGPNGTTNAAGVTQMYATSPVFALKDTPRAFDVVDSFDRSTNTQKFIAEQTYLLGWQCCLIGVNVTTGGLVSGSVASAT